MQGTQYQAAYPGMTHLCSRVESSDSHGSSALVWASRAGHTKVVELLLNHKAAPDALGMYRLSALAWATMHGHQDTISSLLRWTVVAI